MDEKLGVDAGGTDRISNLPKEVLYDILYFLPKREAARTCVLSKSWRFLWTNRLKVSFRELSYLRSNPTQGTRLFISGVNNFLQAHLDHHHNHRIEEFHLTIRNNSQSISLLKKWIPMLTAIGVKELFLYISPKRRLSGSKRRKSPACMDLPSAVFHSECLAELYLDSCNLSLQKITKIHCVRLNELVLTEVNFKNERIFHEIISSCPLITTMCFRECKGLKTIKLADTNKYLKHFSFINFHTYLNQDECSIKIHIPTLETIYIAGSKIRFHGHHKFSNLKKLSLSWLKFSSDSFDCSSCYEFPRLGSLTFANCNGWEQLQLLHISAPKLLYLRCRTIPSITFTTPMPRACISSISLPFRDDDPAWFLKLSGLLQVLSQSQISLSVYQNPVINPNIEQQDIIDTGGNKPKPVVVEQLRLNMGHLSSFPSYLNGLFSICRPRYIAQLLYLPGGESEKERDHKELTQFLCNFLKNKRSDSGNQEILFRHDLEELTIESFDMSGEEWMSECALPESNRIRFRLRWSEACDESRSNLHMLES